jgi:hypothetical protein
MVIKSSEIVHKAEVVKFGVYVCNSKAYSFSINENLEANQVQT